MLLCSCCAMPTCPQPVLASIVPPHRQRTVGLLTQSVVFRMGHFPCRAAVRESSPRRAVHCLPAVCNRPPHAERTERQSKRFCGNALRLFANSGTPLYCCAFCKDRPLFYIFASFLRRVTIFYILYKKKTVVNAFHSRYSVRPSGAEPSRLPQVRCAYREPGKIKRARSCRNEGNGSKRKRSCSSR